MYKDRIRFLLLQRPEMEEEINNVLAFYEDSDWNTFVNYLKNPSLMEHAVTTESVPMPATAFMDPELSEYIRSYFAHKSPEDVLYQLDKYFAEELEDVGIKGQIKLMAKIDKQLTESRDQYLLELAGVSSKDLESFKTSAPPSMIKNYGNIYAAYFAYNNMELPEIEYDEDDVETYILEADVPILLLLQDGYRTDSGYSDFTRREWELFLEKYNTL